MRPFPHIIIADPSRAIGRLSDSGMYERADFVILIDECGISVPKNRNGEAIPFTVMTDEQLGAFIRQCAKRL